MKNETTVKKSGGGAMGLKGTMVNEVLKMCENCGDRLQRLQLCQKCRRVAYCGAECQKKHWYSGHREQCRLLQDIASADPPRWTVEEARQCMTIKGRRNCERASETFFSEEAFQRAEDDFCR